jgi:hypothetical protein
MSNIKIEGLDELIELRKNLDEWNKYAASLNGTTIDSSQTDIRPGSKLHQASEDTTEEESAQFEIDEPEISAFLDSLENKLDKALE